MSIRRPISTAHVLRDVYISGTLRAASRVYYQYDANYNTTAIVGLVGGTLQITQRYIHSPYGTVTVLNADWTTATSQIPLQPFLHQGGRLDPVTGLYLFRHRDYSPTVGNWVEQDPVGYVDARSLYVALRSAPVGWLDYSGLACVPNFGRKGDKYLGIWFGELGKSMIVNQYTKAMAAGAVAGVVKSKMFGGNPVTGAATGALFAGDGLLAKNLLRKLRPVIDKDYFPKRNPIGDYPFNPNRIPKRADT